MWVAHSGRAYFRCLLDTNAVSEILKRPEDEGRGFIRLYGPDSCVPCFTVHTAGELYRNKPVFRLFLDFFSAYPCAILKPMERLLSDEVAAYPDPSGVEPILHAGKPAITHPKECIGSILSRSSKAVKSRITWRGGTTTRSRPSIRY